MKYLQYVNIRQGTDSSHRFGNGNTQPHVALPFGMTSWAIQTNSNRGSWFYHPNDRSFEGIRLTHMACNWLGDYGQTVFMPETGEPLHNQECRWSSFRPEDSVLSPDYLRLTALRYRYTVELTPTERCAVMRINYSSGRDVPRFAVIPFETESELRVENGIIYGISRKQDWKSCENFALYYVVKFDCAIDDAVLTHADNSAVKGDAGTGCGVSVRLERHSVEVRIGSSYLSHEQALLNLERETFGGFDAVRARAIAAWESKLGLIEIEAEEARMRTFYSCMYRLFLFPRKFYEIDAAGKEKHYCPHDGKIRDGKMYVDNGFWDTARSVYPLFSLIAPEAFRDALEGFVNIYRDSGWLPKWPSPGETGLMPGTYIDGVIADAAVKGIADGSLLKKAYEGMLKHATEEDPARRYGRHGTADYNRLGYLPYDKYRECTNHTLDYVYGDFCIGTAAGVLGDEQREKFYLDRAKNYRKLFDKEVGFIHAKDSDGNFKTDFDPLDWGGEYCEGGAYQNAFAVYHDVDGLAGCYGGKAGFVAKLDELFARKPDFNAGAYRYELHEMSEMAAADFGQCAISNQPSFHLPYLYSHVGELGKTQYWVTKIVDELFTAEADGFPGDEDTGTMAAWYIFACLGFYPVCPGKAEFTLGKAQVRRAVAHLGNGKDLIVTSTGNQEETRVTLGNKPVAGTKISYFDLVKAGTLAFEKQEQ